jgi:3-hydroxybutyryl-CoA dehydrogenase
LKQVKTIAIFCAATSRDKWKAQLPADAQLEFVANAEALALSQAGVLILEDADSLPLPTGFFEQLNKPSLVGAQLLLAAELGNNPHIVRFSNWPGLPVNRLVECCTLDAAKATALGSLLGWNMIVCAFEPGYPSSRTIAMIVNEAYFALEAGVSSKTDIDTAMKLGVNYPFGPFEWSEKIGIQKIYQLLLRLAKDDPRYAPCSLLDEQAKNKSEVGSE